MVFFFSEKSCPPCSTQLPYLSLKDDLHWEHWPAGTARPPFPRCHWDNLCSSSPPPRGRKRCLPVPPVQSRCRASLTAPSRTLSPSCSAGRDWRFREAGRRELGDPPCASIVSERQGRAKATACFKYLCETHHAASQKAAASPERQRWPCQPLGFGSRREQRLQGRGGSLAGPSIQKEGAGGGCE